MRERRYQSPKAKPGELLAKFGKHEGDLDVFYCFQEPSTRADTRLLCRALEGDAIGGFSLRRELEARGFS